MVKVVASQFKHSKQNKRYKEQEILAQITRIPVSSPSSSLSPGAEFKGTDSTSKQKQQQHQQYHTLPRIEFVLGSKHVNKHDAHHILNSKSREIEPDKDDGHDDRKGYQQNTNSKNKDAMVNKKDRGEKKEKNDRALNAPSPRASPSSLNMKESNDQLRTIGFQGAWITPSYPDMSLPWTQPGGATSNYQYPGRALVNLGNTCYLNASLQCLLHCAPLTSILMSKDTKVHTHPHPCPIETSKTFCSFCALQGLSRALFHGSNNNSDNNSNNQKSGRITSALSPRHITSNIRSICRTFRIGRQEDAHEFLRHLLDAMLRHSLGVKSVQTRISQQKEVSSVIHRIFGGCMQNEIHCLSCGYISVMHEPFLDISIEVAKAASVQGSLEMYTRPERLDGSNKYHCSKCGKLVAATKRMAVRRAPNVLSLHLKRFDGARKNNKHLDYSTVLDLKPCMASGFTKCTEFHVPLLYKLVGVLVHHGHSPHSGHYFSYVKSANNVWYLKDDSNSSQSSENSVLKQRAYMLFYVRIEDSAMAELDKASKENYAAAKKQMQNEEEELKNKTELDEDEDESEDEDDEDWVVGKPKDTSDEEESSDDEDEDRGNDDIESDDDSEDDEEDEDELQAEQKYLLQELDEIWKENTQVLPDSSSSSSESESDHSPRSYRSEPESNDQNQNQDQNENQLVLKADESPVSVSLFAQYPSAFLEKLRLMSTNTDQWKLLSKSLSFLWALWNRSNDRKSLRRMTLLTANGGINKKRGATITLLQSPPRSPQQNGLPPKVSMSPKVLLLGNTSPNHAPKDGVKSPEIKRILPAKDPQTFNKNQSASSRRSLIFADEGIATWGGDHDKGVLQAAKGNQNSNNNGPGFMKRERAGDAWDADYDKGKQRKIRRKADPSDGQRNPSGSTSTRAFQQAYESSKKHQQPDASNNSPARKSFPRDNKKPFGRRPERPRRAKGGGPNTRQREKMKRRSKAS